MADTNNQNSFLDYAGLALFWNNVKQIIEDNKLVTTTAITDLDTRVDQLESANANSIISKTYSELKTLRDSSQLVPGQQYRITDYTCTTIQENTQSAGHVFDIIVTADSENKLNEEARAIQHEGDTYFTDCDLNAWKIWYCLDNDYLRFGWADNSDSGRGVIYRMIDEWNNDCPYDFKNILYYGNWDYYAYTFNWFNDMGDLSCEDLSVAQYAHDNSIGGYSHTYNNIIKSCERSGDEGIKLNCCVFLNMESYSSGLFFGCYSNSFGNDCYDNTFGNICYDNTFGNDCYLNSFGDDCSDNTFFDGFSNNTFFGSCSYNSFGYNCDSNSFGLSFYKNSFGDLCSNNSFGNSCSHNSFGYDFSNNSFGSYCSYNSFGDNCSYIKFASNSSASSKYNYYQNNYFGDGCAYIVFTGSETASDKQQVQNYKFAQGLQGTSSEYLTIDGKRNRAYETYISMDTDGIVKESIIAEKLDKMIKISYNDLVTLRSNSKLIPGQQYRITDYICTTTQANTRAAGNLFDIIVTADSENKLNEEARAIQHTNDKNDYFAKCNLNAWKLWYCLDNDTNRFAWADNTNGRGVIYRMIDEFGNDCPYDFKNIQFARWQLSNPVGYRNDYDFGLLEDNWFQESTKFDSLKTGFYGLSSTDNVFYYGYNENNGYYQYKVEYTISGSPTYCYTFGKDTDYSINGSNYNNVIKEYKSNKKIQLNNIVFLNINCYKNSFANNCFNNTFGNYCYSNTFANNCFSNSFAGSCNSNSFGNGCYNNTFGDACCSNTLGNDCDNNSFGYGCSYNSFDNYCRFNGFGDEFSYNSFGNGCYSNSFGNYCYSNTFANNCYSNSFSDGCENNNFGNYCYSNTLGNDCDNNSFGNYCYINSFGDNCSSNIFGTNYSYNSFGNNYSNNSFGNNCNNIKFVSDSDDSAFTNYYRNNHFGDGCEYILFKAAETASPNNQVQNYNLSQGLKGTSSAYLTINGVRNRSFETKVAKNSAGTLKIYCEADLIL